MMSKAPSTKVDQSEAVYHDDQPRRVLVDLFRERGDELIKNRNLCQNLLNDLCPGHRLKALVLVTMVREGFLDHDFSRLDPKSMIARLADQAEQRLGFKREHAVWAAESWALAMGRATEDELRKPFICSYCKLPGNADAHWCEKTVICPRCKARLGFDRHLQLTNCEGGVLPTRAIEASCWLVIDEMDGPESLTEQRLQSAIRGVLDDATFKPTEKVKKLDLRRVIGLLDKEAREILNELDGQAGLVGAKVEELLEGILRAFKPLINGLRVSDELDESSLTAVRDACRMPTSEKIVGTMDFAAFGGELRYLIFGVDAVYYCNSSEFIPSGPGCFRIEAMERYGFSATGLHSISFGDSGEVLDTSGAGVSKRTLLLLLDLIRSVVANRAV
ncbi:MAG: hypothetical protein RJP95_04890 [Pirellulales bacterium]